jgi:hypothetical protein
VDASGVFTAFALFDAVAEVKPAAVIAAAIAKTDKLLNMGFLFIPSPQQLLNSKIS